MKGFQGNRKRLEDTRDAGTESPLDPTAEPLRRHASRTQERPGRASGSRSKGNRSTAHPLTPVKKPGPSQTEMICARSKSSEAGLDTPLRGA
jgi:hypothetical protein